MTLVAPEGRALLSPCGGFRYHLERRWADGQSVAWVMLNPSTADASADDPTIRKCIGFSTRWGFGHLQVVNLFPLRATDPRDLKLARERFGPMDNDAVIHFACLGAALVVLAWGQHGAGYRSRARSVVDLVRAAGTSAVCLGRSKSGEPLHPLMLGYDTPREVVDLDREIERVW